MVTHTEKDEGVLMPAFRAGAQDEASPLLVHAIRQDDYEPDDDEGIPRPFATGHVAKLSIVMRLERWIRKKLGRPQVSANSLSRCSF